MPQRLRLILVPAPQYPKSLIPKWKSQSSKFRLFGCHFVHKLSQSADIHNFPVVHTHQLVQVPTRLPPMIEKVVLVLVRFPTQRTQVRTENLKKTISSLPYTFKQNPMVETKSQRNVCYQRAIKRINLDNKFNAVPAT